MNKYKNILKSNFLLYHSKISAITNIKGYN